MATIAPINFHYLLLLLPLRFRLHFALLALLASRLVPEIYHLRKVCSVAVKRDRWPQLLPYRRGWRLDSNLAQGR
jgi:hypothetical protein